MSTLQEFNKAEGKNKSHFIEYNTRKKTTLISTILVCRTHFMRILILPGRRNVAFSQLLRQ